MSAGAIGGAAAAGATSAKPSGFGAMASEDFIKIMITELTHQDPFQPQDTGKLLEQLSSLRNIESQLGLEEKLSSLVLQNQISTAGNMIGKLVTGLSASNSQVQGVVTSVRVQDGKAMLELDSGHLLAMERVTEIAGLTQ